MPEANLRGFSYVGCAVRTNGSGAGISVRTAWAAPLPLTKAIRAKHYVLSDRY